MLVSDFDYELPGELIAQQPLPRREESRMMVLERKTGKIVHSRFKELPAYLGSGDVLVLNNTRVRPARAWGKREGKEVEFLFLEEVENRVWEVLCRPSRKARPGDLIVFPGGFEGTIIRSGAEGRRTIRFSTPDILSRLRTIGFAPLPPYIKRRKNPALRLLDLERYQTVFARKEGAVAAPTAGLHFTREILDRIKARGTEVVEITLNVGLATFQPVRAQKVEDHRMLEEQYSISPVAVRIITAAKRESRPVTAVGTTSVRTLESAWKGGKIRAGRRTTGLFIHPGCEFRVVDRLLTNFHLPRSTLLMLVAAFAGLDFIKKAYREAISRKYRFYSYGDCMLIL